MEEQHVTLTPEEVFKLELGNIIFKTSQLEMLLGFIRTGLFRLDDSNKWRQKKYKQKIHALREEVVQPPHLSLGQDLLPLLNDIEKLSEIRNVIAHSLCVPSHNEETEEFEEYLLLRFNPHEADFDKITWDDLCKHSRFADEVVSSMGKFLDKLLEFRPLPDM